MISIRLSPQYEAADESSSWRMSFIPPAILNIVMLTRYRIVTILRGKKGLDFTRQGTIRRRQNIAAWFRSAILHQNIDSNFLEWIASSRKTGSLHMGWCHYKSTDNVFDYVIWSWHLHHPKQLEVEHSFLRDFKLFWMGRWFDRCDVTHIRSYVTSQLTRVTCTAAWK